MHATTLQTRLLRLQPILGLPASRAVCYYSHQLRLLLWPLSLTCASVSLKSLSRRHCLTRTVFASSTSSLCHLHFLVRHLLFLYIRPSASYSTGHRCRLAPNVRTPTGRTSTAISTAASRLRRPSSPFRPPEAFLPFHESLFFTKQRNRGISLYRLRLPLPQVPSSSYSRAPRHLPGDDKALLRKGLLSRGGVG